MVSDSISDPPTVISSLSGTVEVKLGSTFEIACEARGMPPPLISWNHDGINLTDQYKNTPRYMLEVNNINMSGVVECVANNGVGEPASSSINLIVLCKNYFFAPGLETCTLKLFFLVQILIF